MRLGDIVKLNNYENAIITYVKDDYIECVFSESSSKTIITDKDWFSFHFSLELSGSSERYLKKDTLEEIIILSQCKEDFIENHKLKEGKIFNVVAKNYSPVKNTRVIIDNINLEKKRIEVSTDTLVESDSLTYIINVINGISKKDDLNDILDLQELDEDDESDNEKDAKQENEDKKPVTVKNFRESNREKLISIQEKELSHAEKIDQITYVLQKYFTKISDNQTLKNSINFFIQETTMKHDLQSSGIMKFFYDFIYSKHIQPQLNTDLTKNSGFLEQLNTTKISSLITSYQSGNVTYLNFIDKIVKELRIHLGEYDVNSERCVRLIHKTDGNVDNDGNDENDENVSKGKTKNVKTKNVKKKKDTEFNQTELKLLPDFTTFVKDETKSNLGNTISQKKTLENTHDTLRKPINYNLNDVKKSTFTQIPPLPSDLKNLDVFRELDFSIQEIPIHYLLHKSKKYFMNNGIQSKITGNKINEKGNTVKNTFKNLALQIPLLESKKSVNLQGNSKKLLGNFIQNPIPFHELLHKKIQRTSFKKKDNQKIDFKQNEKKICIGMKKWNDIEKNVDSKYDSIIQKLKMLSEGKFIRNAYYEEDPNYFYDIHTNEILFPKHIILQLLVEKNSFSKTISMKYKNCLLNQWCETNEEKYFSIVNNELIQSSLNDDHGFGENVSYISNVEMTQDETVKEITPKLENVFYSFTTFLVSELQKQSTNLNPKLNFIENLKKLVFEKIKSKIEFQIFNSFLELIEDKQFTQVQKLGEKIEMIFTLGNSSTKRTQEILSKWKGVVKKNNKKEIRAFISLVIQFAYTNIFHNLICTLVASYIFTNFQFTQSEFSNIIEYLLKNIREDKNEKGYNEDLMWMYGYSQKKLNTKLKEDLEKYIKFNFVNFSVMYWKYKIVKNEKNNEDDKGSKKSKFNYPAISTENVTIKKPNKSTVDFKSKYPNSQSFIKKVEYKSYQVTQDKPTKLDKFWESDDDIDEDNQLDLHDIDSRCFSVFIEKICFFIVSFKPNDKSQFKLPEIWKKIDKSKNFYEKIKEWIDIEKTFETMIINELLDKESNEKILLNIQEKLSVLLNNFIVFSRSIGDTKIQKSLFLKLYSNLLEFNEDSEERQTHRLFIKNMFLLLVKNSKLICNNLISERQNIEIIAEILEDEASEFMTKDDESKDVKKIKNLEKSKHLGIFSKGALHQASGVSLDEVKLEDSTTYFNYQKIDGLENMYDE
tara:strand:- start:14624 stop:18280 length:3657 start_codon:yes stop_codon:yes gene_type:complete